VIDFLTSDPAIVIFSGFGLVATAFTILSDARAQRAKIVVAKIVVKRPVLVKDTRAATRRGKIAA